MIDIREFDYLYNKDKWDNGDVEKVFNRFSTRLRRYFSEFPEKTEKYFKELIPKAILNANNDLLESFMRILLFTTQSSLYKNREDLIKEYLIDEKVFKKIYNYTINTLQKKSTINLKSIFLSSPVLTSEELLNIWGELNQKEKNQYALTLLANPNAPESIVIKNIGNFQKFAYFMENPNLFNYKKVLKKMQSDTKLSDNLIKYITGVDAKLVKIALYNKKDLKASYRFFMVKETLIKMFDKLHMRTIKIRYDAFKQFIIDNKKIIPSSDIVELFNATDDLDFILLIKEIDKDILKNIFLTK